MLTISRKLLRELSKALNKEPSIRPDTLILVEQLKVFVHEMEKEERRANDPEGEGDAL